MPTLASDPARPDRGPDRVHSRLLHRPSAACRPFPGLRLARQDLRGADPARRHPGHPHRLLRQAAALLLDLPRDPRTRRFVLAVLVAFLPAAVIGAAAHKFIKAVLFESPWLDLHHVDRRRRGAAGRRQDAARSRAITTSWTIRCRSRSRSASPVPRHDPRRVALGRHHRRRAAARRRQALGDRVLVLPRHADHGRRVRLRSLQELGEPGAGGRQVASRSASWWPSSPACWSCATCSTSSAGTASRRSPGGASSSAAWASARWPCWVARPLSPRAGPGQSRQVEWSRISLRDSGMTA